MPTVTISSKNQITLPVEALRALGLKAGDKLDLEVIEDRMVMWPKPPSYTDALIGSMKGFWGTADDIDKYVEELRWGPEREEWLEEIDDLLAANKAAGAVVETLRGAPHMALEYPQIEESVARSFTYADSAQTAQALGKLKELGVIRELPAEGLGVAEGKVVYRLVRRFAHGTGRPR